MQDNDNDNGNDKNYDNYCLGNLQRPQEVLEAGLRGGELRPGQHGHHRRVLHAQGHQRRGRIPEG